MSVAEQSRPRAGKDFPWEHVAGFFLRLEGFHSFAQMEGDTVKGLPIGSFGLAVSELPNPDVAPEQRLLDLPIEHQSDFKSLYRAHLDSGVRTKDNEIVLLYEPRRGLFGGKRPSFHVACYPKGTWSRFFDAVSRDASQEFQWPHARFFYSPSSIPVFRSASGNLFQP
jgi:hypothetical protein